MKATPIPRQSRLDVAERDGGRCIRCHATRHLHWHHRRSRRVRDEYTHQPCNGILLCSTCHAWVHAHPTESRERGYILPFTATPPKHPVMTLQWGWVNLHCDGSFTLQPERGAADATRM